MPEYDIIKTVDDDGTERVRLEPKEELKDAPKAKKTK